VKKNSANAAAQSQQIQHISHKYVHVHQKQATAIIKRFVHVSPSKIKSVHKKEYNSEQKFLKQIS
jgi:hypothetical protein